MTEAWTWHGGNLAAAKRHFGGDDWIDLSTGINPLPWPGADRVAIDWQRLPDGEALAHLEAVAAEFFGVAPRHIGAVPGTEIGLRIAGRLIGGEARHATPSYRTHGEMIAGSLATADADLAAQGGTIILANPNNPDGRILAPEALDALLATRGDTGWLLVDEAFADCDPTLSIAARIADDRRLLVFRSFGKFFGLAGVRLGFILGPAPFVQDLRATLGAWPLSAAAIAIGTAAYADAEWFAATRRRLPEQAAALDAVLTGAGYRPQGACPLFRLIETGAAPALFDRLARRSILTRPFADQPHWLRLGLPADNAALARLADALADG
ncbi:threonine-phosphate decarboxylase [Sphingopyxis sp. QXT-31]|uniref:aminotransferase class I/II-fold pyridoxal phosphate-dependent enzyme n=1 Tax=Sphingopyxis sp. QXT-31 TaxID=1357916 RepID=UPI0009795053|nr:aminotransferase class I/II-fold pyridoxal phosphate-dependent enzyme [Sphingopyxis sp. QXT-31]APZ98857.1 threonine-phosphate decarboxylase [Sphingopyxis sp. QXT-31]